MNPTRRTLLLLAVLLPACATTAPEERSKTGDLQRPGGEGATATGPSQASPADANGEGTQPPQDALIRVHYPAGSRALSITRKAQRLGTPVALVETSADTWELPVKQLTGPLAFQPTRDGLPARGPSYVVRPGQTLDVFPWFDSVKGTLAGFSEDFESRILDNARGIRMYTPPSYEENTTKRYPVIYMHDGQVIFEQDMAFEDSFAKDGFGSWKAETVMDAAIAAGRVPEAILIGIDILLDLGDVVNGDPTRTRARELTPTPDDAFIGFTGTGQGPSYLRMIVEELRPAVNQRLRTLPDREHTFLMGSSLGGLINVWAGLFHGDTFGAVASLSTATYWDKEVILRRAEAARLGPKTTGRIYVDSGTDERIEGDTSVLKDSMPSARTQARLVAALEKTGYVANETLTSIVDPAGRHDGASWSRRLPGALAFLLGPGR